MMAQSKIEYYHGKCEYCHKAVWKTYKSTAHNHRRFCSPKCSRIATRKVPNGLLINLYQQLGSVFKVGKQVGMCGQSVHERLQKLGITNPPNVFTEAECERIKKDYDKYRAAGNLKVLAKEMGRSYGALTVQASSMGLGEASFSKIYRAKWKYMKEDEARKLMDKFKKSSMGLGLWCKTQNIGDSATFSETMRRFFPDEYEFAIESKCPQETKYRIGRRFEYKCRDELKQCGYFLLRSPASKSPIDLVAIAKGLVLFIQCKRSGYLSPKEWNDLFDLATSVDAIPILAIRSGWKTIEYTRLIDRKDGSRRSQPHELIDPRTLINGKPSF